MFRPRIVVPILTLVLLLCVAAVIVWRGAPVSVPVAAVEKPGTAFALLDQDGARITEAALEGHPSLLFFGFTQCPEVCPSTLYEISGWLDALGDDGKSLRAFFVSVDPERDTPDLLKDYVSSFSDRITAITGDPDEIAKLAAAWHIFVKKVPTDGGDYTVDHTASIILVGADGRMEGTIGYGESDEAALAKLRRLVAP
jgi:protein SCO1/2